MNVWQELITAALVGTDRHALTLPSNDDGLGQFLSQLDGSDPDRSLLSAAATLSLYQQAGCVPVVPEFEGVSPCPRDPRPLCGDRSAQHLKQMLAGDYAELLPEWLATVAKAGKRLPPDCLPALLDWGRKHPKQRDAILSVLGPRGRWLAAQNPEWDYVADFQLQHSHQVRSVWETGSSYSRQCLLQQLRADNPDRARDLLELTWKQDKAPDRAAFLATFPTGLSLEDEAFLDAALDDNSKQVRNTAADLLSQLPRSQLTQRAIERIQHYVKAMAQPTLQIEVTPPSTCPKEAIRHGLNPQSPSGISNPAWWLLQLVAAVPPSYWSQMATPTELIQVASGSEWKDALLEGWAIATARHRDVEWAKALLEQLPSLKGYAIGNLNPQETLMNLLPVEQREAAIVRILTSNPHRLSKNHPAMFLLRLCQHPWTLELSHAVLHRVSREITTSKDNYNWGLRSTVKGFSYYMNPSILPEAIDRFSQGAKEGSYWAQTTDEFLAILQFRALMVDAIGV